MSQLLSSSIGGENKYSERVLFYSVHLLSSLDQMNLKNISLLLTDSSKRAEFVSQAPNDEIKRFFDEEFNDIYIHHFNDAVLPILNFVGEYELYLGGNKKKEDLLNLIEKNPITVITFNPNFFGKRMINFLAGAVINQMYILAITEKLKTPTILVMDEFQRIETKVVKDMLSETRKFNLYTYLSMQYLGQLSKEVHDSIVSNIRNIVAFKLNKQDATMISSIMEIKIEESFKKARTQTELEESKKEMFVRLHQRECIVRLFDGKKYILPMKLHVVDVARWGYSPTMELSMMDAKHDVQTDHDRQENEPGPVKQEAEREEAAPPAVAEKRQEEKHADEKPAPSSSGSDTPFGMALAGDELARLPDEEESTQEEEAPIEDNEKLEEEYASVSEKLRKLKEKALLKKSAKGSENREAPAPSAGKKEGKAAKKKPVSKTKKR
ncbi:MAG: type IV secretory system conjugative DNA transfer family protein [Candidatus Micrarchaeota archaeon]|nr:type IV secretory system conjugative DNA transfer family protein [Candidatus Micrarchaeota archaeon]